MPSRTTTRLTTDTEAVTRLRTAIGRTSKRLRNTEAGRDLSPTQLSVLGVVAARGPIALSELARREGINPTMLSRIVGKLENHGWVVREQDPVDRRAFNVSVTAAGRTLQKRIAAERTSALLDHLATLPDEHLDALQAALPALEALAESLLTD